MGRGNIHRRVEDLEQRAARRQPAEKSEAFRKISAVLDELAYLKQSCADRWTGPSNSVRVPDENIPRQILGPGYTQGDLCQLAAERAADKGAFDHDEIPQAVATLRHLREQRKDDWDEPVEWERGGGGGGR